jgi:tetratricopeptide (TPR) repeat protein
MSRSRVKHPGRQPARDPAPASAAEQSGSAPAVAAGGPVSDPADAWLATLFRAAVIVLAVLWIYSPAYHGDWLWDDDQLLTANPTVQATSLQGLAKLWFDPDGADYFPLSYTALWAQWPFFGQRSTGYHVTSILLHAVSALLVWRLFWRMRIPGAWLGGMLFAIHPLCVESVAWVSETKNTLSLPLFLLSCIFWVEQDEERPGPRRTVCYWLSIVCFLLAMFAKTSMVALPVVLLLHAWWKRGEITPRDLWRTAPFFLISLALGLITIHYQHGRAIGQEKILVDGLLSVNGFLQRTAVAGMAILFYLWKTIAPINLLPIYPRWEVPQPWQFLAWPLIGWAATQIWANRGTAERPGWGRHAAFGLGFFLLMVTPVLGFVTISYMRITWVADHFVYLPMLGVIALLAAAAATWYESAAAQVRPLFLAGAATVLAVLALSAFVYAGAWSSEDALWTHTLAINEKAWQAHNRLGAKKFARNEIEAAHHHFTRSTALRPDLGETHNNLGTTLSRKGRMDEAIKEFAEARRLTPYVMQMNINLYNALAATGRTAEAEAAVAESLAFFTEESKKTDWRGDTGAHLKRGTFLVNIGRHADAVNEFAQAVRAQPGMIDLYLQLAGTQQAAGQFDASIATLQDVLQRFVRAGLPRTKLMFIEQKIADAQVGAGRFDEAIGGYRRLLAVDAGNPVIWNNMAVAAYKLGRRPEAIQAFERAVAINPNMKDAVEGLAKAKSEEAAGTPAQTQGVQATPGPEPRPAEPPLPFSLPASPTLGPAATAPAAPPLLP